MFVQWSCNDTQFSLSLDQNLIQESYRLYKWYLERWCHSANNCSAWEVSREVWQSKYSKFM